MATPKVGEDIEDVCAKCGDCWHAVMAKLGERIAKVVCKRCGSQHNYRSANTTGAGGAVSVGRKTPVKRRSAKDLQPAAPVAPAFDASKPPRKYAFADTFFVGERVDHPSFGVGVVSSVPGPGKFEVVFPEGARTLACAKTSANLERPVAIKNVPISDRPPAGPAPSGSDGPAKPDAA